MRKNGPSWAAKIRTYGDNAMKKLLIRTLKILFIVVAILAVGLFCKAFKEFREGSWILDNLIEYDTEYLNDSK
jgi:hypothetical protein